MTSVAESRNETPQPLSLLMYSGLKTRSQTLAGIGVLPRAAFTLSTLMPTVVKPHSQLTMYSLPGSMRASWACTAGSRYFRFGILLLSILASRPPSICSLPQFDEGTTMS
ncbi:MAG: hypothetical protein BWY83_00794 [bacterium ADurb.Bin478]|nr:MAG: hypothetical protein BWY83_00794 [bacterium ADurb.Bin478]